MWSSTAGILSPAATLREVEEVLDDDTRDETNAEAWPPKAEAVVADRAAAKNAAIFMVNGVLG